MSQFLLSTGNTTKRGEENLLHLGFRTLLISEPGTCGVNVHGNCKGAKPLGLSRKAGFLNLEEHGETRKMGHPFIRMTRKK